MAAGTGGLPPCDAVRILNFAHAAEYINEIGQAVQAAGGRMPARWLEGVLHRLKHQGPHRELTHLAWMTARYPSPLMQEKLTYLQKREAHMQYPTYAESPTRRSSSGYSWHKPFLRRPPSTPVATAEVCAKNETHPYTFLVQHPEAALKSAQAGMKVVLADVEERALKQDEEELKAKGK